MRSVFIGNPIHWALAVAIVAAVVWMGKTQLHRLDFMVFLTILLGMTAGAVAAILLTYRRGDRVTRDPLEDDER